MKFVVHTFLALTLLTQSALADQPLKQPETVWHNFATSEIGALQWKVDPETHKMNFRTCEHQESGDLRCRKPMLMRGMNPEDLNLLLDYYVENLASASGFKAYQIWGLISGSAAVAVGYIGAFKVVQGVIPEQFISKYPRLAIATKNISHISTFAGVALLAYLAIQKSVQQYRQGVITKKLRKAINETPAIPPEIRFEEPAVYREFISSFRQGLWEFTHGGNGYHSDVNIMLQ